MDNPQDMLKLIRIAAEKKILFLPHAVRQMSRLDRMISTIEVKSAINEGELVEDYPEDVRGHSCLVLGQGKNSRPIHVVCSPKEEYLAVITAYIPSPRQWEEEDNFSKRIVP
jgi:Domain of unknown function (DUF4258)